MPSFPAVLGLVDGQPGDAVTFNVPLSALRERTDYLKAQIDALLGTSPFSSVRVSDAALDPTATPTVNSFVYLDPATNTFKAARADIVNDLVTGIAGPGSPALAIGLLVQAAGTVGTVVMFGRVDLSAVPLSSLMQNGETFRDGLYYLSAIEAGKMTTNPGGVSIILGVFRAASSTYAHSAYLSPQWRDLLEAHIHQGFILPGIPAGDQERTGAPFDPLVDFYRVRGIKPDDYQPGGGSSGEPPVRLFLTGQWLGQGNPTYTVWIEGGGTDMTSAIIRWTTDDGSDDDGGIGVRVSEYENPVPIGTKGLQVVLEKGYDSTLLAPDWNLQDFWALDQTVPQVERQWTVKVPERIRGWMPKWVRQVSVYSGSTATPDYQLLIFGRYVNPDGRATEQLLIEVSTPGDFNLNNVGLTIKDRDGTTICTIPNVGYNFGGPPVNPAYLIDDGGGNFQLWLLVSPFKTDHTPVGSGVAVATDAWTCDFLDEAPDGDYRYHLEVDAVLQAYYPMMPLEAAALEVNGVAQARRNQYWPDTGTFTAAERGFYWFGDQAGETPFAQDFAGLASPGSEEYLNNIQLFVTRNRFNRTGVVTSLTPGSNMVIVDKHTGEPATVGDLEARAQLSVNLVDTNQAGFQVVKGVNNSGQLVLGPVVEKLIAGPGIVLSPSSPAYPGQGTLRLDVAGAANGEFNEIALLNAKQERVRQFSYVKLLGWDSGLATNVDTAFIVRFRIPQNFTGDYRVVFYATMFGLSSVNVGINAEDRQYAGLVVSYSILQDLTLPGGGGAFVFVPRNLQTVGASGVLERAEQLAGDVPVGKPTIGYAAYDTFLLHNDPDIAEVPGQVTSPVMSLFPLASEDPPKVTAGNLISIKFSRTRPQAAHAGNNFEYKGALGFVNLGWRLVAI